MRFSCSPIRPLRVRLTKQAHLPPKEAAIRALVRKIEAICDNSISLIGVPTSEQMAGEGISAMPREPRSALDDPEVGASDRWRLIRIERLLTVIIGAGVLAISAVLAFLVTDFIRRLRLPIPDFIFGAIAFIALVIIGGAIARMIDNWVFK